MVVAGPGAASSQEGARGARGGDGRYGQGGQASAEDRPRAGFVLVAVGAAQEVGKPHSGQVDVAQAEWHAEGLAAAPKRALAGAWRGRRQRHQERARRIPGTRPRPRPRTRARAERGGGEEREPAGAGVTLLRGWGEWGGGGKGREAQWRCAGSRRKENDQDVHRPTNKKKETSVPLK